MKQPSEPMVPLALVERMIESYERQIEQLHALLAPKAQPVTYEPMEKAWLTEDEEEAEFIAQREAEARQMMVELGFNSEDIKVE